MSTTTVKQHDYTVALGRYDGVRIVQNAGKAKVRLLPPELARKWSEALSAKAAQKPIEPALRELMAKHPAIEVLR